MKNESNEIWSNRDDSFFDKNTVKFDGGRNCVIVQKKTEK